MGEEGSIPVVDVVFGLEGTEIPADYAYPLWRETVRWLPWLTGDPHAGIHPLRTAPTGYGVALLAQRAKLVLRVPQQRAAAALALAGRTLALEGSRVAVGAGVQRPLRPSATLHARRVALGAGDDAALEIELARLLAVLAVGGGFITGRRQEGRAGERAIVGASVALVELKPAESLRVQCEGIGGDRGLGWGLFVPHKSIAAVT